MLNIVLATLAASAASAASPAPAARWSDPGFVAAANVAVHRGGPRLGVAAPNDRERRRGRNRDRTVFIGGDWGYHEDNAAWQPNGFNDWWHERPARSMPRWLRSNQACERVWWSGSGWRC